MVVNFSRCLKQSKKCSYYKSHRHSLKKIKRPSKKTKKNPKITKKKQTHNVTKSSTPKLIPNLKTTVNIAKNNKQSKYINLPKLETKNQSNKLTLANYSTYGSRVNFIADINTDLNGNISLLMLENNHLKDGIDYLSNQLAAVSIQIQENRERDYIYKEEKNNRINLTQLLTLMLENIHFKNGMNYLSNQLNAVYIKMKENRERCNDSKNNRINLT